MDRAVLFGSHNGDRNTWTWDGGARNWTQLSTTTNPGSRRSPAMCYDSKRDEILLYGGLPTQVAGSQQTWALRAGQWVLRSDFVHVEDTFKLVSATDPVRDVVVALTNGWDRTPNNEVTWEWTGEWKRVGSGPPAHRTACLVWDPMRRAVVAVIGTQTTIETWLYEGATKSWQQIPTNGSAPPLREVFGVAFDPTAGRLILFGGSNPAINRPTSDTWSWDSATATWSLLSPANRPPDTNFPAIATDPIRKRIVYVNVARRQTWEWDGNDWLRRNTPVTPSGQDPVNTALAYDVSRKRMVFVDSYVNRDFWEWDGVQWENRGVAATQQTYYYHLAHDPVREQMLFLSGIARTTRRSTQFYRAIDRATYSSFGSACVSSRGRNPTLEAAPSERPWIGETFTVRVADVPPGATAELFTGLSNTAYNGVRLPWPLTFLGRRDCSLHVSIDVRVPFGPVSRGTAELTIPIPVSRALIGVDFYQQAAVFDPASIGGIAMSNATIGRVGSL